MRERWMGFLNVFDIGVYSRGSVFNQVALLGSAGLIFRKLGYTYRTYRTYPLFLVPKMIQVLHSPVLRLSIRPL